jgi:DNA repair exonuclease SbcCD nuclease subunit
VKLLHVTDTHLGVDRWFFGAPPGWRRAADHLAAFRAAVAPALAGEVDVVVHTGDLFDRSRPPARAVEEARGLLTELGRRAPVVLMPGNHDRRGLLGTIGTGIPGVQVHDAPARVVVAGVRLAVVPWMADARDWAAAAQRACEGGVDLLLAHQAFDGCRVERFVFRAGRQPDTVGPSQVPRGVSHVLSGHIRPRQSIRCGDAFVVFPGSSERTAFAERDEVKEVADWDLSRAPTFRWRTLPTRPMRRLASPDSLGEVAAGDLVQLVGAARTREFEREVLAAGGWVSPWAEPSRQLGLFGGTA